MIRTYSELVHIPTYEERYEYLKLFGKVGAETFGHDRYLNQALYTSPEWRRFRREIIIRDNGCDMGVDGYDINGIIIIHHINPITIDDILNRKSVVFDKDNVVCVSHNTHNAIHYSDNTKLILPPITRQPNDTCPWRR